MRVRRSAPSKAAGRSWTFPPTAPEVTFAVDDLTAAIERVESGGGSVLMPATAIDGVGELAFVTDPAGNVLGLMRFDEP